MGITRDSYRPGLVEGLSHSKVLVESDVACRVCLLMSLDLSDLVVIVSITSTKYGEGHSPNANTLAGAANLIGPLSPPRLKSTPYSVLHSTSQSTVMYSPYPWFTTGAQALQTTNLDEIMKHYL